MTVDSDDSLVQRCRRGDPLALAILYRRHAPAVLAFSMRLVADRSTAEDVLHETFLRVFDRAYRYEGRDRCRSWLLAIAHRLVLDRFRREARRTEALERMAASLTRTVDADPYQEAERHEVLATFESALSDLSPDYAAALHLRLCEGYSYREIAEIVGAPEGTVRSRVHHAIRRIQSHMKVLQNGGD